MANTEHFFTLRGDAQTCLRLLSASVKSAEVHPDFSAVSDWCGQVADPVGMGLHKKHGVPWNDAAQVLWRGVRFSWLLGDVATNGVLSNRDLARFDCSADALPANPRGLTRLITFEVHRAHSLLDAGVSVLAQSPLATRVAWSEQIGRTRAQLHAIARAGAKQLDHPVGARPTTWVVPANRLRLDSRRYGQVHAR